MRTEKLLTASDVIEVLGITDNILRSWDKSGILKPVNDEGKRFFRGVDIEKIKIGQVPAKQEKQGIESILNSTAMKTMLFINSISTLNEKSKKLAMQGNLKDSIKYLDKPSLETLESLFLALEGLEHESFFHSSMSPNLITNDLEQVMDIVSDKSGAPCIVIMGGNYNRKLLEVQPDGKVIVFAKNKPSALNVLDNYLNTL